MEIRAARAICRRAARLFLAVSKDDALLDQRERAAARIEVSAVFFGWKLADALRERAGEAQHAIFTTRRRGARAERAVELARLAGGRAPAGGRCERRAALEARGQPQLEGRDALLDRLAGKIEPL